jgi:hypothetical protein
MKPGMGSWVHAIAASNVQQRDAMRSRFMALQQVAVDKGRQLMVHTASGRVRYRSEALTLC